MNLEEDIKLLQELVVFLKELPQASFSNLGAIVQKSSLFNQKIQKVIRNLEIFQYEKKNSIKEKSSPNSKLSNNQSASDSKELIDYKFMKSCLAKIEKFKKENSNLKKKIKIQTLDAQEKEKTKILNKPKGYIAIKRENEILKIKNKTLALKLDTKEINKKIKEKIEENEYLSKNIFHNGFDIEFLEMDWNKATSISPQKIQKSLKLNYPKSDNKYSKKKKIKEKKKEMMLTQMLEHSFDNSGNF